MLHGAPLTLRLQAGLHLLRTATGAAAPITTTLLLPGFGPSATHPAFDALSEAGAGTDGRTTYVATVTKSHRVDVGMSALKPWT
jgi:hypothetical protein